MIKQQKTCLKLFSLNMDELIVDPTDKVWKLHLTLKEVTKVINSPKIYQQIAYLEVLLKDYVDKR